MRLVLPAVIALAAIVVCARRDTTSARPAPEAAARQEIAKHQRVHPALDLRSTVLLAVFMLPVLSLFKDGMGLIPNLYLILMAWVTFAGVGASVISAWASWTLFQLKDEEKEAAILQRISRRKVIAYYAACTLLVVDAFLLALGVTDALT